MNNLFDEVLLVEKPISWTSFDVVAKIRSGLTKEIKHKLQQDDELASKIGLTQKGKLPRLRVGHSGTLDPAAEGLLIIAIGAATKKIPELTKQDKVYEVSMQLGFSSPTGDREGDLHKDPSYTDQFQSGLTKEAIEEAIMSFEGKIEQYPPAYSAVKINGTRAYELARKGVEVKTKPRTVQIHSVSNINVALPKISFDCHVSSGTYIRTLVEDIAQKLGTLGYMDALRRTKIGEYDLKNAQTVEQAVLAAKELATEVF